MKSSPGSAIQCLVSSQMISRGGTLPERFDLVFLFASFPPEIGMTEGVLRSLLGGSGYSCIVIFRGTFDVNEVADFDLPNQALS